MRLGIIGGVDRSAEHFRRVARDAGHEIEHHDGHVTGRAGQDVEAIVERCDLVIIVTDTNSHNAVHVARRAMRARGREPILLRRLGASRFRELVATLPASAQEEAR